MDSEPPQSRRPIETPFNQQVLPSLSPIFTPYHIIGIYLAVALFFIPLGAGLLAINKKSTDYKFQYDGPGTQSTDCQISSSNANKTCTITFNITKDLPEPVHVYYELDNFYSNHRKYVQSFSQEQLLGRHITDLTTCYPLSRNGTKILNPCGLIANTLFNDVIEVAPGGPKMIEKGIAWDTDVAHKFVQPKGFVTAKCTQSDCQTCLEEEYSDSSDDYSDCKLHTNAADGVQYAYWYPLQSTTQYLHESFPEVISPLDGVKDEHFIVWMRVAGLRQFRKPYGRIVGGVKKGDVISFKVTNNYYVSGFGGKKWLVMSHTSPLGAPNAYWGNSFITSGVLILVLGLIMMFIQYSYPRPMGDVKELLES